MITLAPYTKRKLSPTLTTSGRIVRNSTYVTKVRQREYFPEINIENTWRGASEIVRLYNLTATAPFIFTKVYGTTANYCVCVRWSDEDGVVHRYKLNSDVGEILYVPLYNNELIPTEYILEIWNTPEETLTGTLGYISYSRFTLPADACEYDDGITVMSFNDCNDITFDLSIWQPNEGEYYIRDGDCGETIIGILPSSYILHCPDDDTFHLFTVADNGEGQLTYFVDQDTTVGPERTVVFGLEEGSYKLQVLLLDGVYHLEIVETVGAGQLVHLFLDETLTRYMHLYLSGAGGVPFIEIREI
jgi:hypothetical protein